MNQMTVAEVTEFLKRQKETTTFTFNMVNPDNFMMVIELKIILMPMNLLKKIQNLLLNSLEQMN